MTALRSHQETELRRLLAAVLPANPFYRQKFVAAGFDGTFRDLEDFFARCPFTAKSELVADQEAHPPYGSNLTYPLTAYTRCHQTSGTSGFPLRWLDTPESWDWLLQGWMEVYRAAGVGVGDRVLFAFSFGPFIGFWMAFEAAERLGCLCLAGGGFSSTARLRLLLDHQITVLCCTPTYALHLAQTAARERIELGCLPLRCIVVAGEPGGSIPATRRRLEMLWPTARVFDHHGMTEVGPVTYECPAQPGTLHLLESAYLAEIRQTSSPEPTAPGTQGELVLTTLGRLGSPLIRYRTGDLVRAVPSRPCACGRSAMALAGGILGRADDMVIIRGVNLYPSAVEEVLRGFVEVVEYRVHVMAGEALTRVKVEIEPAEPVLRPADLAQRIEKTLADVFALRIPVAAVPLGSLPRFELKARRWIKS